MKRSAALIAIVALAGCQQPGPAVDPFLYRSTVPPPGSAIPAAPVVTPGPQPYYTAPPAAGPSPCAPQASPPVVQPTPVLPAPVPVVPSLPPRNFPQRGGFDFPQSSNGPPASNPKSIPPGAASGTLATNIAPSADTTPVAAAATSSSAPLDSKPSVIRIVESPLHPAAALPAENSARPIVTSGTPTNPVPIAAPAILPVSAALPLAAESSPATGAGVNYPGDHPGLTYGYDPGYKALRGNLEYSVTTRLWRLRYLPPAGPIDEYGGSVMIADGGEINGFESGDFVAIQGTLSPPTSGNTSATYAISRIKRQ